MTLKRLHALIILFITLLLTGTPLHAGDVTSAPSFVPSFPMLAGENVMLMWIPAPGAVKYKIYFDGKEIGEAPAPPFTTPAPTEVGKYTYTVTGVDASGEEGPHSAKVAITIVKLEAPKGLMHRFLGEVLNLRWETSSAASIYDVFRSEEKDGEYKLIGSISENKFIDPYVKDNKDFYGKTFYYKVVAIDKFNKRSPKSEIYEVAIIAGPCSPPNNYPKKPLMIMRSKEVLSIKPDISSCDDIATFSNREYIACLDTNSAKVLVIDMDGKEVLTIESSENSTAVLSKPTKIATDKENNIYILDAGQSKILAYNSNGILLYSSPYQMIGADELNLTRVKFPQKYESRMPNLKAILVHKNKIYAADSSTATIQIYDKSDGSFIDYLKNKNTGEIQLFMPTAKMLLGEEQKLYLVQQSGRIVRVRNIETGERVYEIGLAKNWVGAFLGIGSMTFDINGDLVVTDYKMGGIQVFCKGFGRYMYHIGDEKAIYSNNRNRPYFSSIEINRNLGPISVDSKGRLWIYINNTKSFSVREYIGDKIWDSTVDKPEVSVPKGMLDGFNLHRK